MTHEKLNTAIELKSQIDGTLNALDILNAGRDVGISGKKEDCLYDRCIPLKNSIKEKLGAALREELERLEKELEEL